MKVYTITLSVISEPGALAESIQKLFPKVIIGYDVQGPFNIKKNTFCWVQNHQICPEIPEKK